METLVTVATYLDYFSANNMVQILAEHNIPARLLNEHSGTILPSMAVGGIKLQVNPIDAEEALKIITELESASDDDTAAF